MKEIKKDRRNIGVNFISDKEAAIRIWSPLTKKIELSIIGGKSFKLDKADKGYWEITTGKIKPADRYVFKIDDKEYPDITSLSQPDGVHEASEAIDLSAFLWSDQNWQNHPLEEYIIYELHTGTFSTEGTFKGIEDKLPYLKTLGINAIEIMPVAQFPGDRNWGYDGVYPFAVQQSYGGAVAFQNLVNTCHNNGIAVILDVVYNHLGPEGNYLSAYGPFFTEKYKTPWGGALNFDDAWCDGVREYFIENALMWLRDFHIDALRLDAVHAIKDLSPEHILKDIRVHVDELKKLTGRNYYLIPELDLNDNKYINPVNGGGYGMDAQWIDEFHHALRVTSGGDRHGYYEDFNGIKDLEKAYKDAYVYTGQWSPHRKKYFGIKADSNPAKQFVVFSQNHDQVGNRMKGERTSVLVSFEMQKLMAASVLLSQYIPMLFMGEEWSEPHPFLYFVSHTDEKLAEAVRKGRKEEFAAFHNEGEAPDPMDEKTFLESKLQWNLKDQSPHKELLDYYIELIRLRKTHPVFSRLNRKNMHVETDETNNLLKIHRWTDGCEVQCFLNFSKQPQSIELPEHFKNASIIINSADSKWGGKENNQSDVVINPESIKVYSITTTTK